MSVALRRNRELSKKVAEQEKGIAILTHLNCPTPKRVQSFIPGIPDRHSQFWPIEGDDWKVRCEGCEAHILIEKGFAE